MHFPQAAQNKELEQVRKRTEKMKIISPTIHRAFKCYAATDPLQHCLGCVIQPPFIQPPFRIGFHLFSSDPVQDHLVKPPLLALMKQTAGVVWFHGQPWSTIDCTFGSFGLLFFCQRLGGKFTIAVISLLHSGRDDPPAALTLGSLLHSRTRRSSCCLDFGFTCHLPKTADRTA